jgi:hypothetical protein
MHAVGMDQAVRDQPVVLLFPLYRRWPQDQIVDQAPVIEGHERDDAGDGKDDQQAGRHMTKLTMFGNCAILTFTGYIVDG